MAHVHILMGAETPHARPVIRRIGLTDLKDAIARGIADFSAMPTHAVFLCLIYPIIGVVGRLARADDSLDARRAYTALAACAGLLLCGYFVVLVALDASFRLTLRGML